MKAGFAQLGSIKDDLLRFAVIVSQYENKWIFCKHRQRDTWEIPGGTREDGESILQTAARELCEETGAVDFDLSPVCIYYIQRKEEKSYGLLCYAQISALSPLPDTSEIGEIAFFEDLPESFTYPTVHPDLFEKVRQEKAFELTEN